MWDNGKLTGVFDGARALPSGELIEKLRQNYFIEAIMRGSDDQSIGGLNINTSGRHSSVSSGEKHNGEDNDLAVFLSLLEDMRQHLADLEASMAKRRELLKDKYGENYIDGMVDTFLSDEEKEGLETDEQKKEALAKKFLNPDGTIKDKYKDSEEAKYIRDWKEAQKLRPIVQKYEGRTDLATHEKLEIYDAARSTTLANNKNIATLSSSADFKASIDEVLDSRRAEQEEVFDEIPPISI